MGSQQLDEGAIFEVASAIQDPLIQAKYLRQVCHDTRLLARLEGRLKYSRRRWQFSLRTLILAMLVVGCLLAGMGMVAQLAIRAQQEAIAARKMANQAHEEAQRQRDIAAQQAAQAAANAQRAIQQITVGSDRQRALRSPIGGQP